MTASSARTSARSTIASIDPASLAAAALAAASSARSGGPFSSLLLVLRPTRMMRQPPRKCGLASVLSIPIPRIRRSRRRWNGGDGVLGVSSFHAWNLLMNSFHYDSWPLRSYKSRLPNLGNGCHYSLLTPATKCPCLLVLQMLISLTITSLASDGYHSTTTYPSCQHRPSCPWSRCRWAVRPYRAAQSTRHPP